MGELGEIETVTGMGFQPLNECAKGEGATKVVKVTAALGDDLQRKGFSSEMLTQGFLNFQER
jgi:hypothetical protein